MKSESNNKRPSRCLARLVVRWALLGWWLVPMLWILRTFAEMNESYWTGDATEIYWHRDDSMVALRKWSGEKLEAFFQHNAKDLARRSLDSK